MTAFPGINIPWVHIKGSTNQVQNCVAAHDEVEYVDLRQDFS